MSKPPRWITMSPGCPTSPCFGLLAQGHDLSSFISSFRVLRLQIACGSVSSRNDNASVLITFMIGRAVELRIGMDSMEGMSEKESCRAPTARKHRRGVTHQLCINLWRFINRYVPRVTRTLPDHAVTIPSTRLK